MQLHDKTGADTVAIGRCVPASVNRANVPLNDPAKSSGTVRRIRPRERATRPSGDVERHVSVVPARRFASGARRDVGATPGKVAGADGDLTLAGNQNLATGAFTETVTGEICVDLSP